MPEVTVNHKSFPEDEEFELPGLGVFQNGKPKHVEPGNIQGWLNAGYPWPNDDPTKKAIINLPPDPPKQKDLKEDATAELTEEEMIRLAGEDDKENN